MEVSGHSMLQVVAARSVQRGLSVLDLMIVQSPETFVKTRTGILNPTLALWTGKIQVQGLRNLGIFEKLFPITSLDFAPSPRETWDGRMASRAEMPVQTHAA